MYLFLGKNNTQQNEFYAFLVLAFLAWLKFFAVDFRIAEILNWTLFGSSDIPKVLKYSLRAFAVGFPSLAAILCVVVPVSMFPARIRGKSIVLFDFLLSLLAITDMLYVRYYSDIFTFHDIMLIPQTGLIVKSIGALLRPWDVLFFADIPILLIYFSYKHISFYFGSITKKRAAVSLLIVIFAAAVQLLSFFHLVRYRPNIVNAMYDRLSVCAWVSTASFHWGDAGNLAVNAVKSNKVPDAKIREIRGWFVNNTLRTHAPYAAGKNLIMLQCEALQYFVVDLKINGVEVTPNLNRFRHECMYFTRAWSQTAGGVSSDSEFMANSGMFPAALGAAYTRFDKNSYNPLASALRKKGYHAVVIQGTYSAFWNCHRMHPKLGFEKQYSRNTFPHDEAIGLGLSDKAIFTRALEVFSKFRSPFYGFIVTLSSHHPFDFKGLDDGSLVLPKELQGTFIGNYLTAIHYYDEQLGCFIDGIKKNGLMDKSVIVLYGDHPAIPIASKEELGKLLGKKLDTPASWTVTRRVPLLIHVPCSKNSKNKFVGEKDVDTGQMDILPTVSNLLGVNIQTVFGKDLFGRNLGGPVVFRKGTYIDDGVYVDPNAGTAVKLMTGKQLDIKSYDAATDEVERILGYNDLILEKDLIKRILK